MSDYIKFSICVVAFSFLCNACAHRAPELPNYGHVPDFNMTDSEGRSFQDATLKGKVWVADFIYTNCPAECPMMSTRMRRVYQKVENKPDVRIVSFSVDPERDTPSALKKFGAKYGGANEKWIFLTGTPDVVHLLAFTTFHVGDVLGKIEHSTKFILVDKRGDIRGYYSSMGGEGIPQLLDDIERVRTE